MLQRTWFVTAVTIGCLCLLVVACGDDDKQNADADVLVDVSMDADPTMDADAVDGSTDGGLLCGSEACSAGEGCCDYTCVDLQANDNCGSCGNACEDTETCTDGECRCGQPACGPTDACCDAGVDSVRCVDAQSDVENCGGCGISCGVTERCLNGTCACQAGDGSYESCDSDELCCPGIGCRNLDTDSLNCGVCGNACGAGELCDGGSCACGAVVATGINTACGMGESCCGSPAVCVSEADDTCVCGAARCTAGQVCCEVDGGGVLMETCVRPDGDPDHCGGCGNACGTAEVCRGGSCRCSGGFADCDMDPANGCESSLPVDAANCGACGNACAPGEVCDGTGQCALNCQQLLTDCDGNCVSIYSDERHCGACTAACLAGQVCDGFGQCDLSCAVGYTQCGASCFDIFSDGGNCGGCNIGCASGLICDGHAQCDITCQAGFSQCGAGCWELDSHRQHCGACGNQCPPGEVCNGEGTCALTCVAGYTDCGGSCVDIDTSFRHCGACGTECGAGETCLAGSCQRECPAGQELCGNSCVDTQLDDFNCGTCGTSCGVGGSCVGGACISSCPANRTVCGNACVDVLTDLLHCGACGNPCGMGESCQAGSCAPGVACNAGLTDCNGVCVNLQSNVFNCGTCSNACGAFSTCNGGMCACLPGFEDCVMGGAACDTNTNTDSKHCGACGVTCAQNEECRQGACTCLQGTADCDAAPGCEVNLNSDPLHCGMCMNSCGADSCIGGSCVGAVLQAVVAVNRMGSTFGGPSPTTSCAIVGGGTAVECTGSNQAGMLANGQSTDIDLDVPQSVLDAAYPPVDLAVGYDHACAVTTSGTARCWGLPGFPSAKGCTGCAAVATHTAVEGLDGLTPNTTAISVVAGRYWTCFVMADGAVKCTGYDDSGIQGNGPGSVENPTPTTVSGLDGVAVSAVQLAAGQRTACALLDTGAVWCWGRNQQGQVGDGTTTQRDVPTPVSVIDGVSVKAVKITGNIDGSTQESFCAILDTGALMCWGPNPQNRLYVQAPTTNPLTQPTAHIYFDGVSHSALDIAGGDRFMCAISDDGFVWCWGFDGTDCIFGVDGLSATRGPTRIPATQGATRIFAGENTMFAIRPPDILGWGLNQTGVLALPSFNLRVTPGQVMLDNASPDMTAVNLGAASGCASTGSGGAQCWGNNLRGLLGNGLDSGVSPFDGLARDVVQLSGVADVAVGTENACALHTDGRISCWGAEPVLGSFGTAANTVPAEVLRFDGVTLSASQVDVGHYHACAVTTTGAVRCWGSDQLSYYGLLGDGVPGSTSTAPEPVVALDGVTLVAAQVAVGEVHACARTTAGAVHCWGANFDKQLGNAAAGASSAVPVQVDGYDGVTKNAVHIAAGDNHTCAILSTGVVECWGQNNNFQCGVLSGADQDPVQVLTLDGTGSLPTELGLGSAHSCVVFADNSVKCWGSNYSGQLGTETSFRSSTATPLDVTSLDGVASRAISVAAGAATSCALLDNASVHCWGDGVNGVLGNGAVNKVCQPTSVGYLP